MFKHAGSLRALLCALFALSCGAGAARAQCDNCTGICPPAVPNPFVPMPSPHQGLWLPSAGVINALVVFVDFEDNEQDPNNVNWPVGQGPNGIGPGFMNLFIDRTPESPSGRKQNITTYYNDMSDGRLHIVGHPFYRRARRTYAQYLADPATRGNIPYWATREVLQSLTDQDVGGWEQFDHWKLNGNYQHSYAPDGKADLIIMAYRSIHSERDNGWRQEGFADLGSAGDYTVGDTLQLTVDAGATPGSGVTWQNARNYPDVSVPFHEVAHYLLGIDESDRDPNGGLWTALGGRVPSVSNCMNAYERDQLGWITIRDVTDGMETDLPDFATGRVAARIIVPGYEGALEYYFENHQRKSSPYITFAEDGIYTYDVVDRKEKRGLYIIEKDLLDVKVVCADGRWNWQSTGTMPNPSNPSDTTPIFRRGAIDRFEGRTDRRPQKYVKNGKENLAYMWVWRDERTDAVTWFMHPRNFGDGNDTWDADANNVFSPWSNPAARFQSHSDLNTGAAEVVRENSDGSVHVRFYITNPIDAPPSRPQALATSTAPGFAGGANPTLHWEPNIEPDVAAGGTMEVWKRLEPYGEAPGEWAHITTLGPDVTAYTDLAITDARATGGGNIARYRLRAIDSTGKASCYSEDRAMYYGQSPLKAVGGGTRTSSASTATVSIRGTDLMLQLPTPAHVRLRLYAANGAELAAHTDCDLAAGTHAIALPISELMPGPYFCTVESDGLRIAVLPILKP